jgi:hypothetical protein
MNKQTCKSAFKEALKEHDLTLVGDIRSYFTLQRGRDENDLLSVRLLCAKSVDPLIHGSHNGNEIKTIARFKFPVPRWEDVVDYFIFAFADIETIKVDFIIIAEADLRKRLDDMNKRPYNEKKFDLVFWLMPDDGLYETSKISVEGEWYWLSKGVNGRMFDGESNDFTQFLNNWKGIALDLNQGNR